MTQQVSSDYLAVAPEVRDAIADNRPVVALESTIISHGMPYPENVETAMRVEATVRAQGAIPATIGIVKGRLRAGLGADQIESLGQAGQRAVKISRRDIPFALADKTVIGATTVAATMVVASLAGIRVFATGGIGGVHRGAEHSMDISADLQELANTSVAVVCAGAKSILDIGLTREYLETYGVPVIGYNTDCWPAFYTRRSEFPVDYTHTNPEETAAMLACKWGLGLQGGVLVCVPVPEQYAQNEEIINNAINNALAGLKSKGISGKETTPFLLSKIAEITGGSSLATNIELVLNNAAIASRIAISYSATSARQN
ncbi:pseudouridine-5-phosphate glycosidase [Chromatiales bacterium (ex Bugula neritina AB1)]|nr:pseudouridine-5-phosphate glycosidase [Chromatiales bacterium (ex Bugula neritina AB1)]